MFCDSGMYKMTIDTRVYLQHTQRIDKSGKKENISKLYRTILHYTKG